MSATCVHMKQEELGLDVESTKNVIRNEMRVCASLVQEVDNKAVAYADHFIKKERVPISSHLSNQGLKSAKPDICLLRSRRIEDPFTVGASKLREMCRVAMFLALLVRDLVFGFEVEDIDWESSGFEVRISRG